MPKVRITADAWPQPGMRGGYTTRRKGDVVEVTDAQAKRLVKIGAANRVRAKETSKKSQTPAPEKAPESDTPAPGKAPEGGAPAKPKPFETEEAWRAYAISAGMPEEQANNLTRDELVAHFAT